MTAVVYLKTANTSMTLYNLEKHIFLHLISIIFYENKVKADSEVWKNRRSDIAVDHLMKLGKKCSSIVGKHKEIYMRGNAHP